MLPLVLYMVCPVIVYLIFMLFSVVSIGVYAADPEAPPGGDQGNYEPNQILSGLLPGAEAKLRNKFILVKHSWKM
jgi:hypothetical protein